MYIPEYFEAHELVAPEYYEIHKENSFSLFNDHILRSLDNFRKHFDEPITINDYGFKGDYYRSGLRLPNSIIGASKSKHKLAVAFDLKAEDMESLRDFIMYEGSKFFITRVESFNSTPTWCHVEFGFEPVSEIYVFKP